MADDDTHSRKYGPGHYAFDRLGVQVGGSFPAGALEAHLAELAALYNVKQPGAFDKSRWEPIVGPDPGGMACDIGYCKCGRLLVSAVGPPKHGWRCGKCHPFSSEGRIDHAEWVRRRRARADDDAA